MFNDQKVHFKEIHILLTVHDFIYKQLLYWVHRYSGISGQRIGPTFICQDVPYGFWTSWPFKMWLKHCPVMSVTNTNRCCARSHKKQRPQLHCGKSLKSQLSNCLCDLCSFEEGKEICISRLGAEVQFLLDDRLTVHRSITLVDLQLDAQNSYLFTYNTFIKILYMFRALPCSSSGGLRRKCIYAASGIIL